jgi:hypothetical protein
MLDNQDSSHTEHVIIIAFPRQQWLHERASILHSYVPCLCRFKLAEIADHKMQIASNGTVFCCVGVH